jgi:hypothetical protein
MAASTSFAAPTPGSVASHGGLQRHHVSAASPYRSGSASVGLDLSSLDESDAASVFSHQPQSLTRLQDTFGQQHEGDGSGYNHTDGVNGRSSSGGQGGRGAGVGGGHRSSAPLRAPNAHGRFGMLATPPALGSSSAMARIQHDDGGFASSPTLDSGEGKSNSQLSTRIEFDPPNLQEWREKLFNVDDTIYLTNDEYALAPRPSS